MPSTPLIPKIPPLRTDIQEPQQSSAINRPPAQGVSNGANTASNGSAPQHRTSKEWYYYWSKVGEQVVQNTQTLAGLVTYGPHSGRPDPSTMPDGALAVESDRGAIYQNELIQGTPTWRYLAGTMWGTVSPDTRPADLGVHDAGFEFRTTDQPPRVFIWSGGAWVETTPARYGAHSARLAQPVANLWEGALWVETDRGDVIYQLQGTAWAYCAGRMLGTLSPDQRPTDLGASDKGFQFQGTDQQRQFYWSGTAWVETTAAAGSVQWAAATSSLAATGSYQNVPGATVTLTRTGTYLVHAVFDCLVQNATAGLIALGQLTAGGAAASSSVAIFEGVTTAAGITSRATVAQQWTYTAASTGIVLQLQASIAAGAGTLTVGATHTTISATWISP